MVFFENIHYNTDDFFHMTTIIEGINAYKHKHTHVYIYIFLYPMNLLSDLLYIMKFI